MKLVCVLPFGYLKPGDEVEVPDGAGFDPYYFALVPAAEEAPAEEPERKSTSNAEKARESK